MILQLLIVLAAIVIGARKGGIGLGVAGGLGLAVLTFGFGLRPTSPPIDVMLMIAAVIAAASCMQAGGGLDLMVKWAERLLRRHPQHITLLSPLVTYLFTFLAGTGHVAYSVLPIVVALELFAEVVQLFGVEVGVDFLGLFRVGEDTDGLFVALGLSYFDHFGVHRDELVRLALVGRLEVLRGCSDSAKRLELAARVNGLRLRGCAEKTRYVRIALFLSLIGEKKVLAVGL